MNTIKNIEKKKSKLRKKTRKNIEKKQKSKLRKKNNVIKGGANASSSLKKKQ